MTISAHITTLAGLPVVNFVHGAAEGHDAEKVAWRVYDGGIWVNDTSGSLEEKLEWFVDQVGDSARALVIGPWGDCFYDRPPVDELVGVLARLPGLRALFLGDVVFEECEISWMKQTDVTPLLMACPKLEVFRVRGSDGLSFTPVRHEALRELAFESGGLPAEVVRAVGECDLPALEHLELWLGTSAYDGDATVDDLAAILSGARLPSLRYLGLRDAEIVDQIAGAVAAAPVVARLAELDLSMGALGDAGGEALLAGQPLVHLRRLNLSHHFLSEEVVERLSAELPGVDVDTSDAQEEEHGERYIAVSE